MVFSNNVLLGAASAAAAVPIDSTLAFTASAVNSGSQSSYTFSSQAIGTASSDRVVVVGVSAGNSPADVSSMTIGGVGAAHAVSQTNSTETEIWYATVPTGTTASVVVNFSGGKGRCGIGVWALTGVSGVGSKKLTSSGSNAITVTPNAGATEVASVSAVFQLAT